MSTPHSSDRPANLPAVPADPHDSPALDRRLLLGAAGLAGVAAFTSLTSRATAGPLTPPVGPIASTGKSLAEIEPRIAVNATNTPGSFGNVHYLPGPGSYYLTANLDVPTGLIGILMGANATLDLNGFAITGTGTSATGILLDGNNVIRNGIIRNVSRGISLTILNSGPVHVDDVLVTGFTDRGLRLTPRSVVRRCNVNGSGIIGIEITGDYGVVEDCVVTNPAGTGVYLNSYPVLRRTHVSSCSLGAFVGFAGRVESVTFAACTSTGLQAGARTTVEGCSATSISGSGIGFDVGEASEITRSSAGTCVIGFRLASAGRITECSADSCTGSAIRCNGSSINIDLCRLTRNAVALDMLNVAGNLVQRCTALGNTAFLAVNAGGNWYPNVALSGVNTSTNPLANVIG